VWLFFRSVSPTFCDGSVPTQHAFDAVVP
jgi:hypothetical protein